MTDQEKRSPFASTPTPEPSASSPPGSVDRAPRPSANRSSPRLKGAPRTRTSAAFKGFVSGALVLLLLLIFILENTERVKISYFGATAHLNFGVALLLAAVGGALLVAIVGGARISQLRLYTKRHRRDA